MSTELTEICIVAAEPTWSRAATCSASSHFRWSCEVRLAFRASTLTICSDPFHNLCMGAELDLGSEVQRVAWPLTPLQFYRDFVSKNKPCVLTGKSCSWRFVYLLHTQASIEHCPAGAVDHWPALSRWDHAYLATKLQSKQVRHT